MSYIQDMKMYLSLFAFVFLTSCSGFYPQRSDKVCFDAGSVEYNHRMSLEGIVLPVYSKNYPEVKSISFQMDTVLAHSDEIQRKFEALVDSSFGEKVIAIEFLYGFSEDSMSLNNPRGIVVYSEKNSRVMNASMWELNENGQVVRSLSSTTDIITKAALFRIQNHSAKLPYPQMGIISLGGSQPEQGWIASNRFEEELREMYGEIE